MDVDRQTDGVKGKSACAPYGKVNFAFVRKGSIGKGHPHYLFTEYKVSFTPFTHTEYIHNAYIFITSAIQELTSKLACLLLTNRPSWTRSRKKIGASEK